MRLAVLTLPVVLISGMWACGESSATRLLTVDLTREARFAELQKRPDAAPVSIDVERQTIFVPRGQRLNFYVRLAGESRLLIDQIQHTGAGRFRILFQREGGPETPLDDIDSSRKSTALMLPAGESDLVRLSIASPTGSGQEGGLLLVKPRIEKTVEKPAVIAHAEPRTTRPNIIIYLVDTLRKDHLEVYGYPVHLSPNVIEFARTSTVYDRAIAQSTWTRPAVASVLTGLEPHLHGVNRRTDALPQKVHTLAEVLSQEGYETAAFITNGNVGSEYQFDQGFEFFSRSRQGKYHADQLNDRVLNYLDSERGQESDRPLLLYVHAADPHAPYKPPPDFRERFAADVEDPKFGDIEYLNSYHKRQEIPEAEVIAKALALYDAEIASMDEHFGRFLDHLKARDLFDNSLIIFVSDHGEEFWEHGNWSHGQSLYGELLDLPLLVKDPGQREPRRSDRMVQHIDLFAAALEWAGLSPDSFGRGHALSAPLEPDASAYAMIDVDGRIGIAIVQGDWKLIVPRTGNLGNRPKLFDRSTDPGEVNDVWDERPIVGGYLMTQLRRHEAPSELAVTSEEKEVSEELAKELEALGYLNQ